MSTPTDLAMVFGMGLIAMAGFAGFAGFGIAAIFAWQWLAIPAFLCLAVFLLGMYRILRAA